MRLLLGCAVLLAAGAACEHADKAADKKTDPPAFKPPDNVPEKTPEKTPDKAPAKPDPNMARVPKHGVLVEMCGLAGTGPECVLAILDAETHIVTYHPWLPLGDRPEDRKTKELPAARSAELFALAKQVLASRSPKAEDVTDFMMTLSISDAPDTFHIQTSGPFEDPTAKALVDGLVEIARTPSK